MNKLAQAKKENKSVNIKAVIAGIIAIIVVVLLLNFADTDSMYPSEKTDIGFPVTFTSNDIIDVKPMGNNLFVLSKKYVTCLESSGEKKFDFSFNFSDPAIYANDKYGIVFDTMSDKYVLFNKKGIVRQAEIPDNKYIYFSKVTEKGEVAVVTKSSDSACKLFVYDKKGEEKFVWSCGDEYIVSLDISDDSNKIICGTVGTFNSEIYTKVYVFDISESEPVKDYTVPSCSCIDVRIIGKSAVVTCNDRRIVYNISDSNNDGNLVQFNSRALFCSTDFNANTAIITDAPENDEGDYRLSLYNKKNELLYEVALNGDVEDILCDDESVYILDNTAVRQIAKNGTEKSELKHGKSSIGIIKSDSGIYCYYLGGVEKASV